MICNKPNQTESRHRAVELNLVDLPLKRLGLRFVQNFLGIGGIRLMGLSFFDLFGSASHFYELAIAKVDEFDDAVLAGLASRPVVEHHFQQIANGRLVVHRHVNLNLVQLVGLLYHLRKYKINRYT